MLIFELLSMEFKISAVYLIYLGIEMNLNLKTLFCGLGLVASVSVSAAVITEDFSGNTFNSSNFETIYGPGVLANETWGSTPGSVRDMLRTVNDSYNPAADSVLTISADFSFHGSDISFLSWRSDGTHNPGVYSEPLSGLTLRLHENGNIDVAQGYDFTNLIANVDSSSALFQLDTTVRINIVDDGLNVAISMLNLDNLLTHDFNITSSFNAGGHVAFATTSGNSDWDNISIDQTPAAVPEPGVLALLSLGVIGFTARRLKK